MPQNTLAQVANLYDPKKKKLENYLKRATALQLNSITMDSKAHLKAVNLRDSLFHKSMKELIILQSIIKMSEIMPQQSHKKVSSDILKDIGCGRYNKEENGEYKYCYEYLMSDVQVYMEERKTILQLRAQLERIREGLVDDSVPDRPLLDSFEADEYFCRGPRVSNLYFWLMINLLILLWLCG